MAKMEEWRNAGPDRGEGMSGYIYWSAVCAIVALVAHLWTLLVFWRYRRSTQLRMNNLTDELIREDLTSKTRRDLLRRALSLLRDDAHRSHKLRDGSNRYDAWRNQRDALIREVEG